MRLSVTGKGMGVSSYLEGVAEKRARKLERYFKDDTEVHVMLSIEKGRHIAEVTVPFDGVLLRTEEVSGDMYNSIDAALKKLERQIRRHRTKLEKRLRDTAYDSDVAPIYDDVDDLEEEEYKLVRRKKFPVKPMMVEEAELQMDMLRHDFFVFVNGESGDVNVLYKRNDGNLGLIEPELD